MCCSNSPKLKVALQDPNSKFHPKEPKSSPSPRMRSEAQSVFGSMEAEDVQSVLSKMREAFLNKFDPDDINFPFDDACLLRYLVARNMNLKKASIMLQNTLIWRAEFGVKHIHKKERMASIALENSTGKIYLRGFDRNNNVIMYMRPVYENTSDHDGNCLHVIYNLERAVAIMAKRQGIGFDGQKITLLVNYEGYSLFNAPPMRTSRAILDILQNHYPERLNKCYCIRPPWIFSTFWSMISPFIDIKTKGKVQMINAKAVENIVEQIAAASGGTLFAEVLEEDLGGTQTFDYQKKCGHAESDNLNGKREKIAGHPGFSSARYLGHHTCLADTASLDSSAQDVPPLKAGEREFNDATNPPLPPDGDEDIYAKRVFAMDYNSLLT